MIVVDGGDTSGISVSKLESAVSIKKERRQRTSLRVTMLRDQHPVGQRRLVDRPRKAATRFCIAQLDSKHESALE